MAGNNNNGGPSSFDQNLDGQARVETGAQRTEARVEAVNLLNSPATQDIFHEGEVQNPNDPIQPLALMDQGQDLAAEEHHHLYHHKKHHPHGHHAHAENETGDATVASAGSGSDYLPGGFDDPANAARLAATNPAMAALLAAQNPALASQLALENPAMATQLAQQNPGLALQLALQNPALAAQLAAQNPALAAQLAAQNGQKIEQV